MAAADPEGPPTPATVFVTLKPLSERNVSVYQVINRLRGKLARVPGARLFLQASQDIRVGGRQTNAQFQFTLQGDSTAELYDFAPPRGGTPARPELADVNSDQQQKGLETDLVIDRDTAARLGITPAQIDNTLYDAFGQRQVSTIYKALNQYHVVMEVAPRFWQSPEILRQVYVSTSGSSASGTQTSNAPAGTVAASGSAQATVGGLAASHDSFHPAFGGGRRAAGADAVRHRVQHHRAHRHHPADRHRQEERHHDDRLRAGGRARARTRFPRRDLRGVRCCASARS